jgi:hypothetical protein
VNNRPCLRGDSQLLRNASRRPSVLKGRAPQCSSVIPLAWVHPKLPHPFRRGAPRTFAPTRSFAFSPTRPPEAQVPRRSPRRATLQARRVDTCSPHFSVFKGEQSRLVSLPTTPERAVDESFRSCGAIRFGGPASGFFIGAFSSHDAGDPTEPLTSRRRPRCPGPRALLPAGSSPLSPPTHDSRRLPRTRTPSTTETRRWARPTRTVRSAPEHRRSSREDP